MKREYESLTSQYPLIRGNFDPLPAALTFLVVLFLFHWIRAYLKNVKGKKDLHEISRKSGTEL